MADKARAGARKPPKTAKAKPPPRTFAIAWSEEEGGPTLGYVIAEMVVYFPKVVGSDNRLKVQADNAGASEHPAEAQNTTNRAFAELFDPAVGKRVLLKAVALPDGVVSDGSFRVEVTSMSGDPFFQDPN